MVTLKASNACLNSTMKKPNSTTAYLKKQQRKHQIPTLIDHKQCGDLGGQRLEAGERNHIYRGERKREREREKREIEREPFAYLPKLTGDMYDFKRQANC